MLDEEMPNFPETSPQDEYQEIEENEPEQVKEFQEIPDIQEVPIQQPKENIQNQIESTSYQPCDAGSADGRRYSIHTANRSSMRSQSLTRGS